MGFLKTQLAGVSWSPFISSLRSPRPDKSAVSFISWEAQLFARRSVFIFTKLSLWFPTTECYLQIVGAVGYFHDKVSKYPEDEEMVFREHKSDYPHLFSVA